MGLAELLKADLTTDTDVMYNLFNTIWKKDEIPGDWLKDLIVKLAKKVTWEIARDLALHPK